jgi:glycosyltransferase involved in cell wall biosynthesis
MGLVGGDILIGAVGNVRPSKDYHNLLKAVAILRSRVCEFRVVIIGQTTGAGELYDSLLKLQQALGLTDCVHFAGFREDIPDVMRGLDMYVSSSKAEGFSLTIVQAMASALPVVATRCGGPEEIIEDRITGTLVEAESPDALAAALSAGIADLSARRAMGERARLSAVRRFAVEGMVARYADVYRGLLGLRGRA